MAVSARNSGGELDLDLLNSIHINRSALERRAASLPKRRAVKQDWQVAWMLQALRCIDLTTLAGDDTRGRVVRLAQKAIRPVRTSYIAYSLMDRILWLSPPEEMTVAPSQTNKVASVAMIARSMANTPSTKLPSRGTMPIKKSSGHGSKKTKTNPGLVVAGGGGRSGF